MANTDLILAMPVDSNGVSLPLPAVAWEYSPWLPLHQDLTYPIAIGSLSFQVTHNNIAADTTFEFIFEVGTGQSGLEDIKIQFPYSVRADTALGYYMDVYNLFLPEPVDIPAMTRVSVRAASGSTTPITLNGIKMRFHATTPLVEQRWAGLPNNYQAIQTYGDMWVGERIR